MNTKAAIERQAAAAVRRNEGNKQWAVSILTDPNYKLGIGKRMAREALGLPTDGSGDAAFLAGRAT